MWPKEMINNITLWVIIIIFLLIILLTSSNINNTDLHNYKHKNLKYYLFIPKSDKDMFFVLPVTKIKRDTYYTYFGHKLKTKDYDVICMAYVTTPDDINNDEELLEFCYNILNNKSDDE